MKRALLLATLSLVAAGCMSGGDGEDSAVQETEAAATDTAAETEAGGTSLSGAEVFASAGCGNCHTLEEAGASGTVGPSLDELSLSQEEVAEQVRNGGGGMPAFGDQLSDAEIQAVADFVAESSGG